MKYIHMCKPTEDMKCILILSRKKHPCLYGWFQSPTFDLKHSEQEEATGRIR